MTTRTASRAAMYGPLFADTVLDDADTEVATLTTAFTSAITIAKARAVTSHDVWVGPDEAVYAWLRAHPLDGGTDRS